MDAYIYKETGIVVDWHLRVVLFGIAAWLVVIENALNKLFLTVFAVALHINCEIWKLKNVLIYLENSFVRIIHKRLNLVKQLSFFKS